MATTIKNKEGLLALCSPKKAVTVKKLEEVKKAYSEKEAFEYVEKHQSESCEVLAEKLGITKHKAAGLKRSATCKRLKDNVAVPKKTESKKHTLVDWSTRAKKEIGRVKYVSAVDESEYKTGIILTLSAHDGITEQKLLNEVSKRFHFVSYECGKVEYQALKKLVSDLDLPFSIIFNKISHGIYRAKQDDFVSMNLDYCGHYDTFKDEFEYALTNKIVKVKGVCSATFSYGRTKGHLSLNEIKKSVIGFLKLNGNYKLIDIYTYCEDKTADHPKGNAMVQFILQRVE